jgi:uncharacterized membrane protein YdjX (TVP38/TMEM64 family)
MRHVIKDSLVITASIVLAFVIAELDLISNILSISEDVRIAGSFMGGLFFTSILTTAPAIVFLGKIGLVEHAPVVALIGAAGAVCGDLLIFSLFKNHVANDLDGISKRIKLKTGFLRNGLFRWFGVLAGALIIASPFPDELGVAMMGLSKIKLKVFIPVSFIFNFLGILGIIFAARLLVN